MKIFLSYSSKDKDMAEKIFLTLLESGHEVFYDRDKLQSGKAYNKTIENELYTSDLLIFLISPNSIKPSSYTLTEIKYAQKKWKHPKNHVLPVMIEDTSYTKMPNYISAVTVFTPDGNIPAEVASEVNSFNKNIINIRMKFLVSILSLIIVTILAVYYAKYNIRQENIKSIDMLNNTKNLNKVGFLEHDASELCIKNHENVKFIEVGSRNLRIKLNNEEKLTLLLRDNKKILGLIVLNTFTQNKLFKIKYFIDNNCNQIRYFFNSSVGGDNNILHDWDTLGIVIDGNKYFLRLGYVSGSVEINTFYKE